MFGGARNEGFTFASAVMIAQNTRWGSPALRLIGTPRKRTISARALCHRQIKRTSLERGCAMWSDRKSLA
jgi:hypothetical protein